MNVLLAPSKQGIVPSCGVAEATANEPRLKAAPHASHLSFPVSNWNSDPTNAVATAKYTSRFGAKHRATKIGNESLEKTQTSTAKPAGVFRGSDGICRIAVPVADGE